MYTHTHRQQGGGGQGGVRVQEAEEEGVGGEGEGGGARLVCLSPPTPVDGDKGGDMVHTVYNYTMEKTWAAFDVNQAFARL